MSRTRIACTAITCLATFCVQAELYNGLDDLDLGESATTEELSQARGRQDLTIDIDQMELVSQANHGEQVANLQGNTLEMVGSYSGNNGIHGNAFEGMSGIATIIQNTGNQVVIQETTQVNVMFNR